MRLFSTSVLRGFSTLWMLVLWLPPPSPALDTASPEFQSAEQACTRELETLQKEQVASLSKLLIQHKMRMQERLEEKKKNRNRKGIVIFSEGVALYEEILADLEKTGVLKLDLTKARRDVKDDLLRLQDEVKGQEAVVAARRASWMDKHSGILVGILINQGEAETPELRTSVKEYLTKLALAKPEAPATTAVVPGDSSTPTSDAATEDKKETSGEIDLTPPVPQVGDTTLAASGEGKIWQTFGTWTASLNAPEMFDLTVFDLHELKEGQVVSPISGQTTHWKYKPAAPLIAGVQYVYRLQALAEHEGVDVVGWPTRANGQVLTVRTRFCPQIPCDAGFLLQASVLGKLTTFPVETLPPGASIHIDGKPYRDDQGVLAKTPCKVTLPEGAYSIRLSLKGFQDKEVPDFHIKTNRPIRWRFQQIRKR